MNIRNGGFTLIEVLVVVLIIGILAAVALPQYNKAMEKSRAAQAITLIEKVFESAKRYYLENGAWPTQFSQLDVEIPWTGSTPYLSNNNIKDTKSNEDWSIQLYYRGDRWGIIIGRMSGKYQGGGFSIFQLYDDSSNITPDRLFCNELYSNGYGSQILGEGYCNDIFRTGTRAVLASNEFIFYNMP